MDVTWTQLGRNLDATWTQHGRSTWTQPGRNLDSPCNAQNTITGQASSHYDENVDLHEQTRAQLKAQISQLKPASTKRLVVNRHACVLVNEGISNYIRDGGGKVRARDDADPMEGRGGFKINKKLLNKQGKASK